MRRGLTDWLWNTIISHRPSYFPLTAQTKNAENAIGHNTNARSVLKYGDAV
jgi:hypothetical protein